MYGDFDLRYSNKRLCVKYCKRVSTWHLLRRGGEKIMFYVGKRHVDIRRIKASVREGRYRRNGSAFPIEFCHSQQSLLDLTVVAH